MSSPVSYFANHDYTVFCVLSFATTPKDVTPDQDGNVQDPYVKQSCCFFGPKNREIHCLPCHEDIDRRIVGLFGTVRRLPMPQVMELNTSDKERLIQPEGSQNCPSFHCFLRRDLPPTKQQ